MLTSKLAASIIGLFLIVLSAGTVLAEPITIAAGPSLKTPLQAILPMFEKEYGTTVEVVYGSPQRLRQDIEKGAAIDVFLPGAADEVEILHRKGLTLDGGPRVYAQTPLVLITSVTSPATAISFRDVLPAEAFRLAVADPKASALGRLTAGALFRLGPLYNKQLHLATLPHTEDILKAVRTGHADVGIVYRADAINGGQVRIIEELPHDTAVLFGAAMVWTSKEPSRATAKEFMDFLTSMRIQKLLVHYGLDPVRSKPTTAVAKSIAD
jgi:molybdate transport system substrate-binding protein